MRVANGGASRAKIWRGCADSGVRCEARGCSLPQSAAADSSLVRGSQVGGENAHWEKIRQCQENLCHSEEQSDVGIRFSLGQYDVFVRQGDADCHSQFANWLRNDMGWGGAICLFRSARILAPLCKGSWREATEGLSAAMLDTDLPENGAYLGLCCTIPPVRLAPNHLPLHKGGASRRKWIGVGAIF